VNRSFTIAPGTPWPLGAHPRGDGFDFAVVSRHATRIWLELFFDGETEQPSATVELDPRRHRTGDVWHVHVAGLEPGTGYAFRADGPSAPARGLRFDPVLRLYDPYARALHTTWWDRPDVDDGPRWHEAVCLTTPVTDVAVLRDERDGDRPRRPWSEVVLYETHVRGFTMHPSAAVTHPGTYLGLVEKIPHLVELGVTAVELLPIHEFNPRELEHRRGASGPLRNYWGYSPVAFAAPAEGYGTRRSPGCQVDELQTMVRELHRAGIEVLLDVVFNHTAESHDRGPTLSFRALANEAYYLLEDDRRLYRDLSGCGNTVAGDHPIVQDLVLDCLRRFALDLGIDGFRFDLASVLARASDGELLDRAPLIERISEDPLLRDVKLIAEPWDAAGGYQVGYFPTRWSEWNDRYRDDVRRFWRGDPGVAGALATRLCGSADLYQHGGGTPARSINFVTCHDGFTLADLVSYDRKHNLANLENDRDGAGENYSHNHGVEGPTADPAIGALRLRQQKNLIGTLLLSRGVPMILGGDELGRTQLGNNNAYCQDNALSWYDWQLLEQNRDLFRFVRAMIAFRRSRAVLCREQFFAPGEVEWLSPEGTRRDWADPSPTLTAHIRGHHAGEGDLCALFNASREALSFHLPRPHGGRRWRVFVDTSIPDSTERAHASALLEEGASVVVPDRTLVIVEGV
jgi:isoamylase